MQQTKYLNMLHNA